MRVLFDQATPVPFAPTWKGMMCAHRCKIAVVVLGLQQWPSLRPNVGRVVEAIKAAIPGSYVVIGFPSDARRPHPE